jgi:hypothetical protein
MKKKEELYQAIKGSSLFNYSIFNKNIDDKEKNEFLSLLFRSLEYGEWFETFRFIHLGERVMDRNPTQVPFANKKIKNEEFNTLKRVFSEEEIDNLILIIKNMNSHGTLSIKELMDNEDIQKKPTFMRSAFVKLFSSKRAS